MRVVSPYSNRRQVFQTQNSAFIDQSACCWQNTPTQVGEVVSQWSSWILKILMFQNVSIIIIFFYVRWMFFVKEKSKSTNKGMLKSHLDELRTKWDYLWVVRVFFSYPHHKYLHCTRSKTDRNKQNELNWTRPTWWVTYQSTCSWIRAKHTNTLTLVYQTHNKAVGKPKNPTHRMAAHCKADYI